VKRGISKMFKGVTLWVLLRARLKEYLTTARKFMYGLTVHEMDVTLRKERENLDRLFMLVVFGDLVGVPVLPPPYSLRLLPHVLPFVNQWKRAVLRERDLTDFGTMDI
jgi:hypothetical protein